MRRLQEGVGAGAVEVLAAGEGAAEVGLAITDGAPRAG
jgi:hypothetical protein